MSYFQTYIIYVKIILFQVAQFPHAIYKQLLEKKNKGLILILNKCDLVSPSLVVAWQDYFEKKFPRLKVLPFCAIESNPISKKSGFKMSFQSAVKLMEVCQEIVGNESKFSNCSFQSSNLTLYYFQLI